MSNWFYFHLPKPSFALDLATGCRGIRSTLPPGVRYIAAHEFTPACNYKDGLLPKLKDDIKEDTTGVVLALGVLEQVCDVPSFLEGLKSYYLPFVVSYAPVDAKEDREEGEIGWLKEGKRINTMTTGQWRAILTKLRLDRAYHEARVLLGGVYQLVYWFEPTPEWIPFADSDRESGPTI